MVHITDTSEESCPYNFSSEVRQNLALPNKVVLNDVTLREGIQASKVPFDVAKKVALARRLDAVGVPQIQVGYPARSIEDKLAIRAIKQAAVRCSIESICTVAGYEWQTEIEATIDAGGDFLNIALPVSDVRLRRVLKMSRDAMLERAAAAVRLAKRAGASVAFSPIDATRTDLSVLKEVLAAVTEAGADRFYIVDTMGTISPQGMRHLASAIKDASSIPLAVHCHNDLGLALANGLAAVEAGVEVVDVCVNGMGKRAGNLALEEMVVALTIFYRQNVGIEIQQLYDLSQAVAQMAEVSIPHAKPIVGAKVFDFSVDAQLRGAAGHVQRGFLRPGTVGHRGNE